MLPGSDMRQNSKRPLKGVLTGAKATRLSPPHEVFLSLGSILFRKDSVSMQPCMLKLGEKGIFSQEIPDSGSGTNPLQIRDEDVFSRQHQREPSPLTH